MKLASGAVAVAAAGITIAAAGTASAETEVPMSRCWGISPNIVDQPFAPARAWVDQYEYLPSKFASGQGAINIRDVSSLWAIFGGGYDSTGRLDWRNLSNGRTGTVVNTARIRNPGNGNLRFDVDTGPGDVEITLSAVNSNGLWSIPTTSCSGRFAMK